MTNKRNFLAWALAMSLALAGFMAQAASPSPNQVDQAMASLDWAGAQKMLEQLVPVLVLFAALAVGVALGCSAYRKEKAKQAAGAKVLPNGPLQFESAQKLPVQTRKAGPLESIMLDEQKVAPNR